MKKWIGIFLFVLLMGISLMTTVFASKSPNYDEIISCIYIAAPELSTGDEQQIGIVLADDVAADSFELVYQSKSTQKKYVVTGTVQKEGIVVFAWVPTDMPDQYQVIRLDYVDKNGDQSLVIPDENFAFTVREEITDVVSVEFPQNERKLSASVQKNIAEAVSNSLEKTVLQIEQPMLYQNDRQKNIVIALDAGHDSSHAGAQANGIVEEVVTLKLAQYAKEELETYEGITVYMTRTNAACPYPDTIGTASSNDIKKRINAAVDKGARAVISFHLNSYTSSGPKGCLVLCPQGNDSIAVDALNLSDHILEKLCSVGFENDGSRQEQWAITSYSKEKGIPGIIIEHGFISNPEDAAKLKDESCLKAIGIADAQGIAEFYGLRKKDTSEVSLHVGSGEYYIESAQKEEIVLDIEDASMQIGARAILNEKGNSLSQSFSIKRQNDGYYQILNTNSGMALEISKHSDENNLLIQQSKWTGSDEQLWEFIAMDDGACYIRSKLGTYLTRVESGSPSGSYIVSHEKLGTDKQAWKVHAAVEKDTRFPLGIMIGKKVNIKQYDTLTDGIFAIKSENYTGVLGVANSSQEDSAYVELQMDEQVNAAQQWSVLGTEDSYYRIINLNSCKVLSLPKDSDDGSLIQTVWNAEDNQLWEFVETDSGSYFIRSKSGGYLGVRDGKIVITSEWEKQKWVLENKSYSIMGENDITISQMVDCFNAKYAQKYPSDVLSEGGAATIDELCRIIIEEANAEGVRADVVFAQMILETGWLQFTGAIKPEWYNFCGLGAIDTDPSGNAARFTEVREGIRAQVQHLKAYGCKDDLLYECIDPRFKLVNRGCAKYVQWLGVKENPQGYGWASSQGYGVKLMKLINQIQKY